MNILAIIVIALMTTALTIMYQKAKKKRIFGLEKFEKTYDAAVSAYGEDKKDVIVGTMKLTAEALDAEHVDAVEEAKTAYEKSVKIIVAKKEKAKFTVNYAEERAAELERRAQEIRELAANVAKALEAEADSQGRRAGKLKKMIDLM